MSQVDSLVESVIQKLKPKFVTKEVLLSVLDQESEGRFRSIVPA